MKIAILGTGNVGDTIGSALIALGHDVMMGSRTSDNEKLLKFVEKHQGRALGGTFSQASDWCELAFNCLKGSVSLGALSLLSSELKGKILIDLSNPLDSSQGGTPVLMEGLNNSTSLGEQLQNALPDTSVVKALNTMWCGLMVNPKLIADGEHDTFFCGNNEKAKESVRQILLSFGWKPEHIMDLGGIESARGTEMYLPLWLRLYGSVKTGAFNIRVVK